jgi:hypothetical protein
LAQLIEEDKGEKEPLKPKEELIERVPKLQEPVEVSLSEVPLATVQETEVSKEISQNFLS